jgi:hypothetical protein
LVFFVHQKPSLLPVTAAHHTSVGEIILTLPTVAISTSEAYPNYASAAAMKLAPYFIVLILGLLQGALAVKAQQKSVIISFPDDTPDTVMLEAKRTITDAVSPNGPILDETANVLPRVAG